ncbi:MAG: hypothetical protein CMJ83_10050 [Planctomycetes bacterium]|nr:hypothetical protein [Planctomycetota bacterium]
MLEARPKSFCSSTWQIHRGDQVAAEFSHGWWNESAKLIVGDQLYRIERKGWSGAFRLLSGDQVVLSAKKASAWKARFEIQVGDDVMDIVPENWGGKSWIVTNRDGTIIGRMGRHSWWTRRAWVDFPEGMPVSVQAFLLCLAVFMWNRQSAGMGSAS